LYFKTAFVYFGVVADSECCLGVVNAMAHAGSGWGGNFAKNCRTPSFHKFQNSENVLRIRAKHRGGAIACMFADHCSPICND
jgi:hypothetical protein